MAAENGFWLIFRAVQTDAARLTAENFAMRAAKCAFSLVAFALVCGALAQVLSAERQPPGAVDLFEAVAAGTIEARLILRDETVGRVVVTNKTRQPVSIKLPEAFAGVPVLAQIRGLPNPSANPSPNNGSNQGIGAGVGPYGAGQGGIFNIEPEKAVKIKVVGVC